MIWALVLGGRLAMGAPGPPVPIPSVMVPQMPKVSVASDGLRRWQVERPGARTTRVVVVFAHGRKGAPKPAVLRLLDKVLVDEFTATSADWADAGVIVRWAIGADSSRWTIDAVAGTDPALVMAATQTMVSPALESSTVSLTRSRFVEALDSAPRRLSSVHAAAVSQVERGVEAGPVRRLLASDVRRVTTDQLRTAHARILAGGVMGVVVLTDTPQAAWVDHLLADVSRLPTAAPKAAEGNAATGQSAAPVRALVDHGSGSLAIITVSLRQSESTDHLANQMAALAVGGGFDSPLNRALRQEAGLSYATDAMLVGDRVRFRTTVNVQDVGRAVALIGRVLDSGDAIHPAGVERVRRGMLRSAAQELRVAALVGNNFANAMAKGRTTGSVQTQVRAISDISIDTIEDAYVQQMDSDDRAWIITGFAGQMAPILAAAGWKATHELSAGALWPTSVDQ
jgi:hypothetical protein